VRKDRPSRSAVQVSQVLILVALDERYAPLFPPELTEPTRELLTEAGALNPWRMKLIRSARYRRFSAWVARLVSPGHLLHIALRKRVVGDEAVEAVEQGADQILVVGAGMDSLALRVARKFPHVACVELDHPASQRAKRKAVEAAGAVPENLHFVPADLGETSLAEALSGCPAFRPGSRTFTVAEGLTMFLPEPAVHALFDGVHGVTGTGSRFLFTYMLRDQDGEIILGKSPRMMAFAAKVMGEPIRWAIHPEDVPAFIEPHGYRLAGGPGPGDRFDLRSRYLEPAGLGNDPLGTLENISLAERLDR